MTTPVEEAQTRCGGPTLRWGETRQKRYLRLQFNNSAGSRCWCRLQVTECRGVLKVVSRAVRHWRCLGEVAEGLTGLRSWECWHQRVALPWVRSGLLRVRRSRELGAPTPVFTSCTLFAALSAARFLAPFPHASPCCNCSSPDASNILPKTGFSSLLLFLRLLRSFDRFFPLSPRPSPEVAFPHPVFRILPPRTSEPPHFKRIS